MYFDKLGKIFIQNHPSEIKLKMSYFYPILAVNDADECLRKALIHTLHLVYSNGKYNYWGICKQLCHYFTKKQMKIISTP